MTHQNTAIIITGPTASGKTSLAIELANHFQTSIISADSRQCFMETNIGVAKPSPAQLQSIPHYFINTHSLQDDVNAGVFERYALGIADQLFASSPVIIVAGGAGLYIKAFCEGLDDLPPASADIRRYIEENYTLNGLEWLQQMTREHDPAYFATGEIKNPHRLIRALEIKMATGRSIRELQKNVPAPRNFRTIKLGINPPKEQLHANIHSRVDEMIAQGLVDEVRSLLAFRHTNALQTVGYSEIFDHLDGSISLHEATERIKTNTRRYAKRQLTWFRKDKHITWIDSPDAAMAMEKIDGLF